MSNYVKSTNFAAKDSLLHGNPAKIVKGTEIDTEFNNLATAIATKADGVFTNVKFVESGNTLYVQISGTNVFSLDAAGNLTVIGNIISNGTV